MVYFNGHHRLPMQTITKYVADDGTEFSDAKECTEYGDAIKRINFAIKHRLPQMTQSDWRSVFAELVTSGAITINPEKL